MQCICCEMQNAEYQLNMADKHTQNKPYNSNVKHVLSTSNIWVTTGAPKSNKSSRYPNKSLLLPVIYHGCQSTELFALANLFQNHLVWRERIPDSKNRGQHGDILGPVGPRWARYRPHEPCYQGYQSNALNISGWLHRKHYKYHLQINAEL